MSRGWARVYTNLGHHAAPCDNVGVNLGPRLLFVGHDGFQQSIEMLGFRVVMFDERVESLREVRTEGRVVVVPHGRVSKVVLVVFVV